MKKQIAIVKGDGIGPEVVNEGIKILNTLKEYTDYSFDLVEAPMGGEVWKKTGISLPESSFEIMKKSDAILFGANGLPDIPQGVAESAIMKVRQGLDLYVNLRPIKLFDCLQDICPLKDEYIQEGIDFAIIRENTESVYAQIGGQVNNETAINSMVYTRKGVSRIIDYAFKYAVKQNHQEIISVDKANVLEVSRFWRQIYQDIGQDYPNLEKKNFYIDAFCQWLLRKPYSIQTVVTDNLFGDIASDEAAYLIGSLGMAASGNIHPGKVSMYEPIHGSAPDIAGKGIANPIGTILSIKLMLEESFNDSENGVLIEEAIEGALGMGRTIDIFPKNKNHVENLKKLKTKEMGSTISSELVNLLKK